MPREQRGFTLLELIIVLCITSIICMYGISVRSNMERAKLIAAANDIQTVIRNAQHVAYGEQTTNIVAFYPTLGECIHIQNAKAVNKVSVSNDISIKQTNFPSGKLYFRGNLSPSRGGTIVLTSKRYTINITVLPVTGRVKIYPVTKK